eukprot:Lithocolla_globosa_v1_NODE_347_length_4383_cov_3.684466.p3 type:complete len:135 gc:universal NODE_347_length_4383_cov_3.684466:3512-3916(+)
MKLNVYNTKKTNHWQTPLDLYEKLDVEFHFDFDPCPLNGTNGLEIDWGQMNFVNPPYSNVGGFAKKCREEQLKGNESVLLIPARTSTHYFHDWILPFAEVRFIRGRLKFRDSAGQTLQHAPFASILCVYRKENM